MHTFCRRLQGPIPTIPWDVTGSMRNSMETPGWKFNKWAMEAGISPIGNRIQHHLNSEWKMIGRLAILCEKPWNTNCSHSTGWRRQSHCRYRKKRKTETEQENKACCNFLRVYKQSRAAFVKARMKDTAVSEMQNDESSDTSLSCVDE